MQPVHCLFVTLSEEGARRKWKKRCANARICKAMPRICGRYTGTERQEASGNRNKVYLRTRINEIQKEVTGICFDSEIAGKIYVSVGLLSECVQKSTEVSRAVFRSLKKTFVISGYISGQKRRSCWKSEPTEQNMTCAVDVEASNEDEELPVLLKECNTFPAACGRGCGILRTSRKGRDRSDDDHVRSSMYFFFGMMLSDAAYGAILAVACFVMLKEIPANGQ